MRALLISLMIASQVQAGNCFRQCCSQPVRVVREVVSPVVRENISQTRIDTLNILYPVGTNDYGDYYDESIVQAERQQLSRDMERFIDRYREYSDRYRDQPQRLELLVRAEARARAVDEFGRRREVFEDYDSRRDGFDARNGFNSRGFDERGIDSRGGVIDSRGGVGGPEYSDAVRSSLRVPEYSDAVRASRAPAPEYSDAVRSSIQDDGYGQSRAIQDDGYGQSRAVVRDDGYGYDNRGASRGIATDPHSIISQTCMKCHSGNNPKGDFRISPNSILTSEEKEHAMRMVMSNKMPDKAPLTEAEKLLFLKELLRLPTAPSRFDGRDNRDTRRDEGRDMGRDNRDTRRDEGRDRDPRRAPEVDEDFGQRPPRPPAQQLPAPDRDRDRRGNAEQLPSEPGAGQMPPPAQQLPAPVVPPQGQQLPAEPPVAEPKQSSVDEVIRNLVSQIRKGG